MAYYSLELFIVRRNVELLFHVPPKFMFNVNKKALLPPPPPPLIFWPLNASGVTCSSSNPSVRIHVEGCEGKMKRSEMNDLVTNEIAADLHEH